MQSKTKPNLRAPRFYKKNEKSENEDKSKNLNCATVLGFVPAGQRRKNKSYQRRVDVRTSFRKYEFNLETTTTSATSIIIKQISTQTSRGKIVVKALVGADLF